MFILFEYLRDAAPPPLLTHTLGVQRGTRVIKIHYKKSDCILYILLLHGRIERVNDTCDNCNML